MSKIRIQNFGPIKQGCVDNDGWIDIEKVTVFIGNQGSGKSTVAKVISTMMWLEKAINREDIPNDFFTIYDFQAHFVYQRLQSYFQKDTVIEYIGNRVNIRYTNDVRYPYEIKENNIYNVPQIMYVPAERNFLSVVKDAFGIRNLPGGLYTFAEELRKAQIDLNGETLKLPFGELQFRYDKHQDISYLVGKDYELNLSESSSGYQSLVPLYIVTKSLSDELMKGENPSREKMSVEQSIRRNKAIADVMRNRTLSETEKIKSVNEIEEKYINTCFINIVEEPEQNLFPTSQRLMLNSLLGFNNEHESNKLIMTTHSPYLINYLTLAVKANDLKERITNNEAITKLKAIVPLDATIASKDLAIYQLNEKDGTIERLKNYHGLPSDENQLNDKLDESNQIFAELLDLQQSL